jgi:hypothetical protein
MIACASVTWPDAVALSVGAICFVVFLLAAMAAVERAGRR